MVTIDQLADIVADIARTIVGFDCGVVAQRPEPARLAATIRELAADDTRLQQMGRNAR